MRIVTVVFDYRNLNRYARLFDVWDKSVRASNPGAIIDVIKTDAPEWDGSQKASFFSNNHKMALWADYLKQHHDDIIFMDCDMIVTRPLDDAFNDKFDIGICKVGRTYAPYNGGVVFVKNTDQARAFIELWRKVDQELFDDEQEHNKWLPVYKGQNQAAFGKILETNMAPDCKFKFFDSLEWNAVDPDWSQVNPANNRVIHVKSQLRKVCLGEVKNYPSAWNYPVQLFRSFEGESHNPAKIKKEFQEKTGYSPDLENPKTLMEHITVSKFNNRDPLLTLVADKILVRGYVQERGLGDYLVPLLYTSHFPLKLPWRELPDAFFVKMNNASGRNIAVPDKKNIAQFVVEKKINDWMKVPYGVDKGEWAYKNITAQALVEPMLPGEPMTSYKFHCFGGVPKIGQVIKYKLDKKIVSLTTSYVPDWKPLLMSWAGYPIGQEKAPKDMELLMAMSSKLAEPFTYVRVDWLMDGTGKVWFSELTHYPTGGRANIEPKSYDIEFGKLWPESPQVVDQEET